MKHDTRVTLAWIGIALALVMMLLTATAVVTGGPAPEQRELPHDAVPIEHNEPAGGIGCGIWVHRHKGGAA